MTVELKPTHPHIKRSGHWCRSSSTTLLGAVHPFAFCFLADRYEFVPENARNAWNGGIPMLLWTIIPEGAEDSEPLVIESADAEPLNDLVLVDESRVPLLADRVCCVQIMLIDWASVFEIEVIAVESVSQTPSFISVALVADSQQ